VRVSFSGFKAFEVADIKLDAGTEHSLPPIQLELGPVTETVTVEAGLQTVQTTTATITGTVQRKQIEDLPILDRAPVNLVALQAGVNQNGRSNTTINGTRSTFTSLTLDGINIQDNFIRTSAIFSPNLPLISQVAEFTITNSNSPSPIGFGASAISLITPSGTNTWHGEGFWYYRSNAFSANDWFLNASGVPQSKLIQNQGGGSGGGPILKDKLFIYGYYELLRLKSGQNETNTILTSTARQGLFTYKDTSGALQQINLLSIASAKLGKTVGIDPFVAKLLQSLAGPDKINSFDVGDSSASQLFNTAGFIFSQRNNRTRDNWGFKADFVPSPKHAFAVTYAWNRDILDRGALDITNAVPLVQNNEKIHFLSAAWRWSPNSHFTNEFRFGFDLAPANFIVSKDLGTSVIDGGAGAPGAGQSLGCLPNCFIFSNPLGDGPQGVFRSQGRDTRTWAGQYNGSYLRGNHTFSFGWQSQYIRTAPFTCFSCPASYFVGMSSGNPATLQPGKPPIGDFPGGASSSVVTRANNLLASLAGFLNNGSDEFNVTSRTSGFVSSATNLRNYSLNNHAFYFSDSWRTFKNLTLSLGLRYEYAGRLCEQDGLELFPVLSDKTRGAAQAALLNPNAVYDFAGSCGGGTQFYNRDLNNYAPQFGFAWDPWGKGKTSVRGSFSIHYVNDEAIKAPVNASVGINGLNATASLSDLTTTISSGLPAFTTPIFKVPRNALNNMNDFGFGLLPQTTFIVDPQIATPYVQEWSFGIQHQVGWNTILEVSYRGNHGTKLTRAIDLNQINIGIQGFLDDFNRARKNGFICEAAGKGFNPACTLPGSQPLTVISTLPGSAALGIKAGGNLGSSSIRGRIRRGEAGDYLSFFEQRNLCGGLLASCVPNTLVFPAYLLSNLANSNYHAGVVEIRRRWSSGLYFQANYTFSKVLTDSTGQDQNVFDPRLDNANPRLDRSRADFDLTHAFKANFTYELPFGHGHRLASSSSWADRLVGGWNVSSIFTWQTGAPFSILSNRGTLNRVGRSTAKNTAFTTLDAQAVKNIVGLRVTPTGVFIVDAGQINSANGNAGVNDDSINGCVPFGPAGLCNPQPGQVGNIIRRGFSGPAFFNWDFSTFKRTRITERVSTEFRADFFNFLNHPTFFAGDQDINSTTFGKLTSTLSNPRVIQFGLRLLF
jgi:hypothetical protein